MRKRILSILLLACMVMLQACGASVGASQEASSAAPSETAQETAQVEETAKPDYDVELYVFLYDLCGGCGTDSPGCGNCQDIVRYHAIIKRQLGNRLYDGTILYRMYNTRILAYERMYEEYYKAYGMPQNLFANLPVAFIGTPEGGVYLTREKMLDYVGEFLDKYLESGDLAALQAEIDAKWAELYPDDVAPQ